MNRSQDESLRGVNRFYEEVTLPPLNLSLTQSPELLNSIVAAVEKEHTCPKKLHDFVNSTITPPETPKTHEKTKAMNFPISKITIGEWNRNAEYPDDLKVKFYFAKKRLIWESLDNVDTGTKIARLKRKIEIQWADVLSLRVTINSHDGTEILDVELNKRPTFFMETNPQAGKHTQWKQLEQDFTFNHSASIYRRHTLHFAPGVLQKNMEKLVSSDSFWSERIKVDFPSLQNIFFDIAYEDINNNNNNLPHHSHGQTLSFNVNNHLHPLSQGFGHVPMGESNFNMSTQFCPIDGMQMSSFVQENCTNHFRVPQVIQQPSPLINSANDHLHHHSQGFGHVPIGEPKFNMAIQFCHNDGMQMNSFLQDNCANKFLVPQVIQQPSPLINVDYSEMYLTVSQFNNLRIQDESQMRNTWNSRGSQAYAPTLLETQTNSMMFQNTNSLSTYPHQIEPYLQSYLAQEETQNMEHTHLSDNYQTNNIYTDQFPNHGYDQYFGNNNGSMPPNL